MATLQLPLKAAGATARCSARALRAPRLCDGDRDRTGRNDDRDDKDHRGLITADGLRTSRAPAARAPCFRGPCVSPVMLGLCWPSTSLTRLARHGYPRQ